MAIKLIVTPEELGQLPEDLQKEYKQHTDGQRFILDAISTDGYAVENITGLTSALEKERLASRAAAGRLKAYEGIDAEKARDALKRLDEIANFNPNEKVKAGIEEFKKQFSSEYEAKLNEAQNREKALKGQLEDVLVKESLTRALAKNKGSIPLMLDKLQKHIRMREENGKLIPEVIDPNTGALRFGDILEGTPMTIPQLVQEYRNNPDYAAAFEGTGATGSGSSSGSTGSPQRPVTPGAPRVVSLTDRKAVADNFDKIATGEVLAE